MLCSFIWNYFNKQFISSSDQQSLFSFIFSRPYNQTATCLYGTRRKNQHQIAGWSRSSWFTDDTVSPMSEVPHHVPPPPLTVASSVLQSDPRTSGWTPRPTSASQIGRSSAFSDEEARGSVSFWPFGVVDGPSRGVEILIEPPRFLWCGRPVSRLRRKILLMHPWDPPASWLLFAENCHLPTTRPIAAVFALANFVAWSPLKVQRNINSRYRKPRMHKNINVVMAWQTSLQVTTPELTFSFFWVSAVPRQ